MHRRQVYKPLQMDLLLLNTFHIPGPPPEFNEAQKSLSHEILLLAGKHCYDFSNVCSLSGLLCEQASVIVKYSNINVKITKQYRVTITAY